ncbi:hypothetical protein ACI65C_001249 [Semiaphis heraclei]
MKNLEETFPRGNPIPPGGRAPFIDSNIHKENTQHHDWGEQNQLGKKIDIITISNVKIGEFKNQKTLALTNAPQIIINPDVPEANRLKEEFKRIEKKDIEIVKFIKINLIQNLEDQIFININAIIDDVGEVDNVFSKNGQTYEKREIVLIDDSNEKITLTLWNDFATNFMGKLNTKINLRNTKISDYKNQRYLTLNRQSIVSYDVDKTIDINAKRCIGFSCTYV